MPLRILRRFSTLLSTVSWLDPFLVVFKISIYFPRLLLGVACSTNQLVISGSSVEITCLVKLSSTGPLTVNLELDGVKGVANDEGAVLATQKLTSVNQDESLAWTLHLGEMKVDNGVIELSAYNNSDSTCPLLSFSSGTLECEGNECSYTCPDDQYYQRGSDLRSEMNVTCDNSNSQWSHVTKSNPFGDFPICSGNHGNFILSFLYRKFANRFSAQRWQWQHLENWNQPLQCLERLAVIIT